MKKPNATQTSYEAYLERLHDEQFGDDDDGSEASCTDYEEWRDDYDDVDHLYYYEDLAVNGKR